MAESSWRGAAHELRTAPRGRRASGCPSMRTTGGEVVRASDLFMRVLAIRDGHPWPTWLLYRTDLEGDPAFRVRAHTTAVSLIARAVAYPSSPMTHLVRVSSARQLACKRHVRQAPVDTATAF